MSYTFTHLAANDASQVNVQSRSYGQYIDGTPAALTLGMNQRAFVVTDLLGQFLTFRGFWSSEYPDAQLHDRLGPAKRAAQHMAQSDGAVVYVVTDYGFADERIVAAFSADGGQILIHEDRFIR